MDAGSTLYIQRTVDELIERQRPDGSWPFAFEASVMTDAFLLILWRAFGIRDDALITEIVARILRLQGQDGAWRSLPDMEEDVSLTLMAYYGLVCSGVVNLDSDAMRRAKRYIATTVRRHPLSLFAQSILAISGHIEWFGFPSPVEFGLLPAWFPVNKFDLVGYARVHVAPLLIMADRRYADANLPRLKEAGDWFPGNRYEWAWRPVRSTLNAVRFLRGISVRSWEGFLRDRVEPDGTLYTYFTATFYYLFALRALGYGAEDPAVVRGLRGIRGLIREDPRGGKTVQMADSTLWDTSLCTYALGEALHSGRLKPSQQDTLKKVLPSAREYVGSRRQKGTADWVVHNPGQAPGSWGFSAVNVHNPDVDDTACAIRALRSAMRDPEIDLSVQRGVEWLISMQNPDGGWSAFERNVNKAWVRSLEQIGLQQCLTDPSTADLTGHVLECLAACEFTETFSDAVAKGARYLLQSQTRDGTWLGRWGAKCVYGTWSAIRGLTAAGVHPAHPRVARGVQWLLTAQRSDGSWGESALGDGGRYYVPLAYGTVSQTSWALDALTATHYRPSMQMLRALRCLTQSGSTLDNVYPTGTIIPGRQALRYESYGVVWPLVAISHFMQRYG